jgi:uncharacterized RDD family membrane protein YckC
VTAIVQTQRYAGFWIRTAAYLIDAIALSLVGWHDKITGTVVVHTT